MAYADAIRAATATYSDVATLIEGALVEYAQTKVESTINTTATSLTDISDTATAITVAAGEVVLAIGEIIISHGTANEGVRLAISADASSISGSEMVITAFRSNTNGADCYQAIALIHAPSVGAHTYRLQWRVAAGTAYSQFRKLTLIKLQNS